MFFLVLWLDLPSVGLDVHFSSVLYKVSTEKFHNWYTLSRKISSTGTTDSEKDMSVRFPVGTRRPIGSKKRTKHYTKINIHK